MTRKIILFLLLLSSFCGQAQNSRDIHSATLHPSSDTIRLDSLSLVPGSVILRSGSTLLDSSYYTINAARGMLYLDRRKLRERNISADSIQVNYKTFPYNFSEITRHKDPSKIRPDLFKNNNPFSYTIESRNDDIFKMEGLNKSGSISRGISFGNNQDVVVNSNLNLQLSGHLSNNIDILLAATDNNIPIQAEGNTQQLQEFDKVFIQLSNENSKLIAGDFQLARPQSYFMNFNKKAQGVSFSTALKTNTDNKNAKPGIYRTSISAAVSKGKFARNQIQGIESNQGPYRLRGAENEAFIIVLSGTEKVYIDGRLMERGQENDYVINYNTAEITFTARQLITKDKRIVVEFQYSDKNYARSLVHFGNDYEQDKLKLHLHIYSEQDSKNQPLQQTLTPEQKKLLSDVGDTLSLAVIPSADSVAFTNSEVLYRRTDTIIGTHTYPKVFIYSTNSDSAHYRVTFSNVGAGNGNYVQINSSANGKVFQWLLPDTLTGKPRGAYEPVIQLITPKKKQMVTAGADYQVSRHTRLSVEGAVSNNDINTFSPYNSSDDVGYAAKVVIENNSPLGKASEDSTKQSVFLISNVSYEYTQKNFAPIERYRSIEFERDWNRSTTLQQSDQHVVGAAIGLAKRSTGTIMYRINALLEGSSYTGTRHFADMLYSKKGLSVFYNGSFLNSSAASNTSFYRHKSGISQTIKWLTAGVKDEYEDNRFTKDRRDSLLANSYRFWDWQVFAQNADSTNNRYGISYRQRTDWGTGYLGGMGRLQRSALAESYSAFFELLRNPDDQLKITASYRKLQILDTLLTVQKPDNSLVGRIEYNLRLLKGVIYSNTFYEIGSGLEVKKEFSYLEVAAGQGIYTWNDYNENGVKELNEFEIAAFPDQARYIKVYTPTSEYIRTYSNQFSQTLALKPAAVWMNRKGLRKFAARFSDLASYRVERKTTDDDLLRAYNPFLSAIADSTLVTLNSSFRNSIFFNQLNPVFGIDLTFQDIRNKSLLVNGFDTRFNQYEEAHLRWNMLQQINWELSGKTGTKAGASQFFTARDFNIHFNEVQPKISYQPNTSFRLTLSFRYTEKRNQADLGGQKAFLQDYGAELKYNILQKGSLNLKADYIRIAFDGSQNTSLAFEMLDALKTGQNITWGASYQRNLSNNLQLSLTYDGRKSEGNKAIHTGGAQVRAYF